MGTRLAISNFKLTQGSLCYSQHLVLGCFINHLNVWGHSFRSKQRHIKWNLTESLLSTYVYPSNKDINIDKQGWVQSMWRGLPLVSSWCLMSCRRATQLWRNCTIALRREWRWQGTMETSTVQSSVAYKTLYWHHPHPAVTRDSLDAHLQKMTLVVNIVIRVYFRDEYIDWNTTYFVLKSLSYEWSHCYVSTMSFVCIIIHTLPC